MDQASFPKVRRARTYAQPQSFTAPLYEFDKPFFFTFSGLPFFLSSCVSVSPASRPILPIRTSPLCQTSAWFYHFSSLARWKADIKKVLGFSLGAFLPPILIPSSNEEAEKKRPPGTPAIGSSIPPQNPSRSNNPHSFPYHTLSYSHS